MRCVMCTEHATWEHTVFKGTAPTKVRLCEDCAGKVGADGHLERIKAAPDHETKDQAVGEFLSAVGK